MTGIPGKDEFLVKLLPLEGFLAFWTGNSTGPITTLYF